MRSRSAWPDSIIVMAPSSSDLSFSAPSRRSTCPSHFSLRSRMCSWSDVSGPTLGCWCSALRSTLSALTVALYRSLSRVSVSTRSLLDRPCLSSFRSELAVGSTPYSCATATSLERSALRDLSSSISDWPFSMMAVMLSRCLTRASAYLLSRARSSWTESSLAETSSTLFFSSSPSLSALSYSLWYRAPSALALWYELVMAFSSSLASPRSSSTCLIFRCFFSFSFWHASTSLLNSDMSASYRPASDTALWYLELSWSRSDLARSASLSSCS
mmetsp:Transcript_30607/g.68545  ORF Transcript_30607/g.68545 Transcript_30607/m.68545 type:complete len:272 (-) Transcript_30607:892-1707(-)